MTTQVVSDYLVNPFGQTAAELAALIAYTAVPLDGSLFVVTSTSLTSDVASVAGGVARRRLTINLTQPPQQLAPGNVVATTQFQPMVWSTSPNDSNTGGSGAREIQLAYTDQAGNPHTENIPLNGTTPVSAAGTNYYRLTVNTGNFIVAAGADLANDGIIYVACPTALLLGGNVAGWPQNPANFPSTTILSITDASFYVKNPGGLATWPRQFQNWLGAALKQAVGPVCEQAPVFS